MKKLAFLALLGLSLAVYGCGSRTLNTTLTNTTTSGNWEAHIDDDHGQASQPNFVTGFTVTDNGSGNNLSLHITSFSFINAGSCFANGIDASSDLVINTATT